MKVWITKYALSTGVFTRENATVCSVDNSGKMIDSKFNGRSEYYHKPYWHESEAEANAQVLKMVGDKRKSINKQLSKLLTLENEIKGAK